jgi:hypothetical protein
MNPKTAFRNTFKLMNSERPVFVPFVYGLAAKLMQLPLKEMTSDASYYSHSLEDACELFKYDGIINHFDATIEAGAFGCEVEWPGDYASPQVKGCQSAGLREVNPEESSRIQILLETTKRIVMSRGKDIAVIGVLTGPVSLVETLAAGRSGSTGTIIPLAGNLLMKLVKSLCELRVDAIFFREDTPGGGYRDSLKAFREPFTAIHNTIFNLIKHYNGYSAVITRDMKLDFVSELHAIIQPDGLILLGNRFSNDDLTLLQELSASLKIAFGIPLPLDNPDELEEQYANVSGFIDNHKPTGFFYVSDGEIPYDTPAETIHNLIAKIRST